MKNGANNQTAMKLHEARICVDCETVYSRTVLTRCPECASEVFVTLLQLQMAASLRELMPKPMAPKLETDDETENQYILDRYFPEVYEGRQA